MANINEILQRAASLRDETALNSISPERAGGIMYDTLIALNELWLQQGSALVISKIYASVSAMEADTAPVSDLTGQPLRPGQIVVIASSDSDNGTVYRYNGTTSPSWTSVGKIGNLEPVDSLDSDSTSLPLAAHQGKVLDGKISQLGQQLTEKYGDYEDNAKYVRVILDSQDRFLEGTRIDGTKEIRGGIEIGEDTSVAGNVKIDGEVELPGCFEYSTENPEYIKAVLDSENRIIEGIDKDGKKHISELKADAIETKALTVKSINFTNDSLRQLLFPLQNRTIAILGDSIMEFMGGDVPSNNVITLKNYSNPSDTNVYQISQATIVDGILYLTSSLNNGVVTDNSIRLEVVNSVQNYIDTRGWDNLRDKLGAKSVINCGQGGGEFTEMGIVTPYPSTTLTGDFADKLQSFPNQVRMLKRLVSNGDCETPDCIVIWMGVNGTTTKVTDTINEAMAIDWGTLENDITGYQYRTKFYGAVRYGIESLYRAFPDAVIVFLSPVMTNRGNLQINADDVAYRGFDDLKQTADNIRSMANRFSCLFIDALTQIGVANFAYRADTISEGNEVATGTALGNLVPLYLKDGLHPNDRGKVVWCNYLSKMLNNFYFDKKNI